jgi:hypothetical protein
MMTPRQQNIADVLGLYWNTKIGDKMLLQVLRSHGPEALSDAALSALAGLYRDAEQRELAALNRQGA